MLVDGALGCFSRCGIYHSFVVQGLRALPVAEMGNSISATRFSLPFSPADFPSHFYPRFCRRFSLPFLLPILPGIFRGCFSPGIFHPSIRGGSFFTFHFSCAKFPPALPARAGLPPAPNESAKNDTFTISAKSAMLRTQIPAPRKPSPPPPKPHPQIPLSPKGDIGGFWDELRPSKSSPKVIPKSRRDSWG